MRTTATEYALEALVSRDDSSRGLYYMHSRSPVGTLVHVDADPTSMCSRHATCRGINVANQQTMLSDKWFRDRQLPLD